MILKTAMGFATDYGQGDIASLAASRGESAATLRKTVNRMRQRFRQYTKMELAPPLADDATADDEMRALLAALGG